MMSFILCHTIILSIVYIKIHISGLPFILQQFIARNMSLMDWLCGVTPGSLCEQHRGDAQPGSASLPGTAAFVRQLHWALRAPYLPFWSWTPFMTLGVVKSWKMHWRVLGICLYHFFFQVTRGSKLFSKHLILSNYLWRRYFHMVLKSMFYQCKIQRQSLAMHPRNRDWSIRIHPSRLYMFIYFTFVTYYIYIYMSYSQNLG